MDKKKNKIEKRFKALIIIFSEYRCRREATQRVSPTQPEPTAVNIENCECGYTEGIDNESDMQAFVSEGSGLGRRKRKVVDKCPHVRQSPVVLGVAASLVKVATKGNPFLSLVDIKWGVLFIRGI